MGRRRRGEEAQKRRAGMKGTLHGVRQDYVKAEKKSEIFEKYYKQQNFVGDEEWTQFMDILKEPLPTTFRVTGFKNQSHELMDLLQSEYFSKLTQTSTGEEVEPPFQLPWYPKGLAWQINFGRREIRSSDILKELKQFLITETETGNISRQEAVSMIPPLVLDVKPNHRVLDMCAAPGSKTAQIIEMLQSENSKEDTGFVLANDADNKRCYLMCHQVKRLESEKFAVINHDAQFLPGMKYNTPEGLKSLRFDRVLADVPCTGDGTLRKNIDVWPKWNPAAGHALNPIQRRILKRGLELLEVGGRLVYSTCSMNPVEDEAVLASVLSSDQFSGCVNLVDVSKELPGLKYLPGVNSWKVMSRSGEFFSNFSEVPERLQTQIRPEVFPPAEAKALHLERCMRILPHMQNTGGFFVAVLEKVQNKKPEEKSYDGTDQEGAAGTSESPADDSVANEGNDASQENKTDHSKRKFIDVDNPMPLKKLRLKGYKEDPFVFLTGDESFWPSIKDFYNWGDDFPVGLLMGRSNEGNKRNLYFVSEAIKDLVVTNKEHIRFINLGMKILNRSKSKYCTCDYRLSQDGVEVIERFCRSRTVQIAAEDLILLLTHENPFLTRFGKPVQDAVKQFSQGSLLFSYEPDADQGEKHYPSSILRVCGWLGVVTMRTFLSKHQREHLLRLFHQEIKDPEKSVSLKASNDVGGAAGQEPAVSDTEHDGVDEDIQGDGEERDNAGTDQEQADAESHETTC